MTKIYHVHLWGSREDKYRYLLENDIDTVAWTELKPESPFYLFVPQNTDLLSEYNIGWKITEIMPVNSVGIVTARDSLTIHFSPQEVETTVKDFVSLSPEEARENYNLGQDAQDWQVELAQEDLRKNSFDPSKIVPILYRPFDHRYTYYTGQTRGFICRPRLEVMRNILSGNNLGLVINKQVKVAYNHTFCCNSIIDFHCLETANANPYLFCLYVYPDLNQIKELQPEKRPNLFPEFVKTVESKLGYIPTPEAIFYYIYAIFYSPTYRQRYAEFLKIDFPRVPLTSNQQLFQDLGAKGQELVELHLMQSPKLNKLITKIGGGGDNNVTEVTYKPAEERVYINKNCYFEGITPAAWEFKIGGYQVLDKWLKDRKKAKRTLSFDEILHYQKIVVALEETRQIMIDLDHLIPDFPIR